MAVAKGPDVRLPPKAALALGMVFHELATNAAKYGALSNRAGRVKIGWRLRKSAEGERVEFKWTEESGPQVGRIRPTGFGTLLIQHNLSYELNGTAKFDFTPGGLVCALEFLLPDDPTASIE